MKAIILGIISTAILASTFAYARGRTTTISLSSPIELSTVTPAYPCGTIVQDVAKGVCTIYTPHGSVQGNFMLRTLSTKGGGQCGVTVYEIECL